MSEDLHAREERMALHSIAGSFGKDGQGATQRGDAAVVRLNARFDFAFTLEVARRRPRTDPKRAEIFLLAARLAMDAGLPDEAMRVVHEGLICLDGLVPAPTAEALFAVLAAAAPSP